MGNICCTYGNESGDRLYFCLPPRTLSSLTPENTQTATIKIWLKQAASPLSTIFPKFLTKIFLMKNYYDHWRGHQTSDLSNSGEFKRQIASEIVI